MTLQDVLAVVIVVSLVVVSWGLGYLVARYPDPPNPRRLR